MRYTWIKLKQVNQITDSSRCLITTQRITGTVLMQLFCNFCQKTTAK